MAIALSLGLTTAKAQTAAAKIPVSVTQAESEVEPEICPVQLANELQAIAPAQNSSALAGASPFKR